MNGRGAWNNSGLGGTKKYKSTAPGPYYYLGTGEKPADGRDANEYVCHRAVLAYQRALHRRSGDNLTYDGVYGQQTFDAVMRFQQNHEDETGTPWGGIGPQTSEALLMPDLVRVHRKFNDHRISVEMVSGTVRHESNWDAGAVGYVDVRDVGLAQINAQAHPEWDTDERLRPVRSFKFILNYYRNSLNELDDNVRDAVASYNLGIGGARSWIKDGRPDMWTPAGSSSPRNVKAYIDGILAG